MKWCNLKQFRILIKACCNRKIQIRNYKSFAAGDKVIDLDENTLTGRLLIYLNNNTTNGTLSQSKLKLDKDKFDTIYQDIERLKSSVKSLAISQNSKAMNLLKELDRECSRKVSLMKTSDIFELLHIYMKKVPNRIIQLDFYESAMEELSSKLSILNKNDIIQYIFYAGLRKKMTRRHESLRKCINYLSKNNMDPLTAEDFCVICNSTFKTTTKINSEQFLSKIIVYLYNNLHLFKDPALFVTLLKTIRQNRYQDEDLLRTMSCTMFFNKTIEHYSFPALCHILAVYSDYLYYDENILTAFSQRCVEILKDNKFTFLSEQPRLKDIKRLLWCLSNLNYKGLAISDIKSVIIPKILQKVQEGDIEDDFSSLIEITLYLWMLNYRAYELVPYFLNKKTVEAINNLHTPLKQRLNLLLTCMFYEDKKLLKTVGILPRTNFEYNMSVQLEKRPLLKSIINNLKNIGKNHELNKFDVWCQIPGIHIIGVTGYKRNIYKTVHIELLDEYTTLKNTDNLPTGPMELKLRLLEQSDEGLILVDANELNSLSNCEIRELLLDEIEFVC